MESQAALINRFSPAKKRATSPSSFPPSQVCSGNEVDDEEIPLVDHEKIHKKKKRKREVDILMEDKKVLEN